MSEKEVGKATSHLPTAIEEHKSNDPVVIDIPESLEREDLVKIDISERSLERKDPVIIDIPESLEREVWSKCCIQRVHRRLRKVNEETYTPQFVSIGPFHHGKPDLLGMEDRKGRYFVEFCKRTRKNPVDLKQFTSGQHQEVLQNYAGTVMVKGDAFVDMVLVDACFIIELFLRNWEEHQDDYILNTPLMRGGITLDLIIFENQLPYAFLEQLYDFAKPKIQLPNLEATSDSTENEQNTEEDSLVSHEHQNENASFYPFIKLTCDFFPYTKGKKSKVFEIKHFTDLVRQVFCPTKVYYSTDTGEESKVTGIKHCMDFVRQVLCLKKTLPSDNFLTHLRSAKKLDAAGVQFFLSKNPGLADLEIESSNLSCIPCLKSTRLGLSEFWVADETECLLKNVMALEHCLYPYGTDICNYIRLLDQLIDDTEDVDLLVERKIVRNLLGSNDEVAKLVNKLCEEIQVDDELYYHAVCKKLNAHCDNWLNRTKATIKRVYFKDCWTGSTAIVGFFVLLFSISATIKTLFFN